MQRISLSHKTIINPFLFCFPNDYQCFFASLTSRPGKYWRSNQFWGFLSFLKYIYTLFKNGCKVTELDVCKSRNKWAFHLKKNNSSMFCFTYLISPYLNPGPRHAFFYSIICLPIPKIRQKSCSEFSAILLLLLIFFYTVDYLFRFFNNAL